MLLLRRRVLEDDPQPAISLVGARWNPAQNLPAAGVEQCPFVIRGVLQRFRQGRLPVLHIVGAALSPRRLGQFLQARGATNGDGPNQIPQGVPRSRVDRAGHLRDGALQNGGDVAGQRCPCTYNGRGIRRSSFRMAIRRATPL
ncbi:MAG: hypothetical protein ACP5R2_15415, partial [Anaerolineae bacterium]